LELTAAAFGAAAHRVDLRAHHLAIHAFAPLGLLTSKALLFPRILAVVGLLSIGGVPCESAA
jgi:hypothetical protein